MQTTTFYKASLLLGVLTFCSPLCFSQNFEDVQSDLRTKNELSLEKLKAVRKIIQDEKIPLATKLSGLERDVIEKRRVVERLQRLRDNKTVGLNSLKKEVDGRKNEVQFLSTLSNDFLANLESRLHVSEIDRYQQQFNRNKECFGW